MGLAASKEHWSSLVQRSSDEIPSGWYRRFAETKDIKMEQEIADDETCQRGVVHLLDMIHSPAFKDGMETCFEGKFVSSLPCVPELKKALMKKGYELTFYAPRADKYTKEIDKTRFSVTRKQDSRDFASWPEAVAYRINASICRKESFP